MQDLSTIPFIKGLTLSELFYDEAVRPLLNKHFPNLRYTAARIGGGSDVLGFDTPQSRDHDWGPRLTLFLAPEQIEQKEKVAELLSNNLPFEIRGYSTHYGRHPDGTVHLEKTDQYPLTPNITITTIETFFQNYLHYNPAQPPTTAEWLTFPQQHLRTIRHGRVFHDDLGLNQIRQTLHHYPHDLWLYILVGQWLRLDQEVPFVGRTGDVGDELGSRIIATRQIHNLMQLCFLMEKEYAPYAKWFGTAFKLLSAAPRFKPIFGAVLRANDWRTREAALAQGYKLAAELHNQLEITEKVDTGISYFYERPYLVFAGQLISTLRNAIQDPSVLALPELLGSINQLVDATDILSVPDRAAKLKVLYE